MFLFGLDVRSAVARSCVCVHWLTVCVRVYVCVNAGIRSRDTQKHWNKTQHVHCTTTHNFSGWTIFQFSISHLMRTILTFRWVFNFLFSIFCFVSYNFLAVCVSVECVFLLLRIIFLCASRVSKLECVIEGTNSFFSVARETQRRAKKRINFVFVWNIFHTKIRLIRNKGSYRVSVKECCGCCCCWHKSIKFFHLNSDSSGYEIRLFSFFEFFRRLRSRKRKKEKRENRRRRRRWTVPVALRIDFGIENHQINVLLLRNSKS